MLHATFVSTQQREQVLHAAATRLRNGRPLLRWTARVLQRAEHMPGICSTSLHDGWHNLDNPDQVKQPSRSPMDAAIQSAVDVGHLLLALNIQRRLHALSGMISMRNGYAAMPYSSIKFSL